MTRHAHHQPHTHALVAASAGSGKTFRLTNAYLARILEHTPPERILATTFTRVAAGEILDRILKRLAAAALDANALRQLADVTVPELTHEQCLTALRSITTRINRLNILTIDAFFARLVAVHALDLPLPPGWTLLDEQQTTELRSAAVTRAIASANPRQLVALLTNLQTEAALTHAHREILSVLNNAHPAFLATRDNPDAWNTLTPTAQPLAPDALRTAIDAVEALPVPTTNAGKPRKHWSTNLTKIADAARREEWQSILTATLSERIIEHATTGSDEDPTFDRAPIEEHHTEAILTLVQHAHATLVAEHIARTQATRELLQLVDDALTQEKHARAAATFDDPPALLNDIAATKDPTAIYYRLDATIDHLLLDEFQDTSLTQYHLIAPIIEELTAHPPHERSVLCVGDTKQSLYQWREAEPALLPNLINAHPAFTPETLATSYRSSPAVTHAVNALFTHTAHSPALARPQPVHDAAQAWDHAYTEHTTARHDLAGSATLRVAHEPAPPPTTPTERTRALLQTAADTAHHHLAQAPSASIAVIVRYARHIPAILAALRARRINATERRGNPLIDTPPVAAAVSLLRFIDHPAHTAGLYHAARTPLGEALNLHDTTHAERLHARDTARQLRHRIANHGLAHTLRHWLTLIAPHTDARGVARFNQLIALAEHTDNQTDRSPTALARLAEQRNIDEPHAAPVRVMTIHASKGLEFDTVILPLTQDAWAPKPTGVITRREQPLDPPAEVTRYPNAALRALEPQLEDIYNDELQRIANAELCCLYVATTRAKRHLELVVPADTPGRNNKPLDHDDFKPRSDHAARAALAPDTPATPGEVLWSTDHTPKPPASATPTIEAHPHTPRTGPQAHTTPPTLRVTAPANRPTARLATAAPSSARAGRPVNAADILTTSPSTTTDTARGLAIHALLQAADFTDDHTPTDDQLIHAATAAAVPEPLAREHLPTARTVLEHPATKPAFSRHAALELAPTATHATVLNEHPFAVRDDHTDPPRLLQGRFDRITLLAPSPNQPPTHAIVTDFKTDRAARNATTDQLRDRAEHHRPQLEAYARAAAAVFNIPTANITTNVLFTDAPAVVTLPAKPTP